MKICYYRIGKQSLYYCITNLNKFNLNPEHSLEQVKVYNPVKQQVIQMKRFGAVLESNTHLYRYELLFENNKQGVAYIDSSFIDDIGLDNKNLIEDIDEINKIRSWVLRHGFVFMIKIDHYTGYLCQYKQNQFPLTPETEKFVLSKEKADKIYDKFVSHIVKIERVNRDYICSIRLHLKEGYTIDLKINIEQLDDLIGKGANETSSKNRIEDIMEIIKNN